MTRIIFLLLVVFLIIWKLHRINKKVLSAKSYIFIKEIKNKVSLNEANYKANLFDFFSKEDAEKVFSDMKFDLKKDYNNNTNSIILRAEKLGFIDTHTSSMFSKKKKVAKILESSFLLQDPKIFSGNATETTKDAIDKHWDINALEIYKLDIRVIALKLVLEQYKIEAKAFYIEVAGSIANTLKKDIKYLDKEDLDIINEWKNIVNNKKKK